MNKTITAIKLSLGALALGAIVAAQAAAPVITNFTMVGTTPQFSVRSDLNITNEIQCCTDLSLANWVVLTNLWVAQSPYGFADATASSDAARFYRVLAAAPDLMTLIPEGSFTMGDCMVPSEGSSIELPLHTVTVSAFHMDKYLVTKSLWDTVKSWSATNGYSYTYAGSGKGSTHPAQNMDWFDMVKWCNARSQMDGLTPCYYTDPGLSVLYKAGEVAPYVDWAANGYRLPTEAEWEKAARGGASGHRFPWSDANTINWSRANYRVSTSAGTNSYAYDVNPTSGYDTNFMSGGTPYTSPVGSFAPNGYGLYDMAGNVWQWCWDWYGAYSSASQTDPRGPDSGQFRVMRGGSWNYYANSSRCASRLVSYGPVNAGNFAGFRCVRVP
jgi:formylglycine-generating enzyme required for sulfatase activity